MIGLTVDNSGKFARPEPRHWRPGLLLPLAMLALMQCAHTPEGPRVAIVGASNEPRATVSVEIAQTNPQRERGLMYRSQLPADAGMLFIFKAPSHVSFWMHNTQIPIDMLFAGSDRRVIGIIANAEPYSDASLDVSGNSQYVLEVNGGFCKQHGIKVGDRLEFYDFSPAPVD
ncbi:MAG TPA: DUF192 domain-containing protein [Candidatus Binataceae bacterium]|jgi:uncharacterized membrane protein (UPF0127 family)|nr:DUF192 domain-containing protein [Candidatus Binataceae bacterium]